MDSLHYTVGGITAVKITRYAQVSKGAQETPVQ